ncbi:MAG: hypothetical protein AB7Q17_18580 [Phycisphaerae bacterium]
MVTVEPTPPEAPAELLLSTPLVLHVTHLGIERTLLIVQTTRRVYCFDVAAPSKLAGDCLARRPELTAPLWVWPAPGEVLESTASSVAVGYVDASEHAPMYLFVLGTMAPGGGAPTNFHALVPTTGQHVWSVAFAVGDPPVYVGNQAHQTPAIGAIQGSDPRHMVFCTTFRATAEQPPVSRGYLFAAFADGSALHEVPPADVRACGGAAGTFGSVGLHDGWDGATYDAARASLVFASDDFGVYSYENRAEEPPDPPLLLTRRSFHCHPRAYYFSGAGALTTTRHVLWIDENHALWRFFDCYNDPIHCPQSSAMLFAGYFGDWGLGGKHVTWRSLCVDRGGRAFVSTAGGGPDTGALYAFENEAELFNQPPFPSLRIVQAWKSQVFYPPVPIRTESESPPAIDEDGTLIITNRGYVIALRPLLLTRTGTAVCGTSTSTRLRWP